MLLDDHNPGTSNPTLSDIMEAFTSLSKKVDALYSRDQQGNAAPQCPIENQQGNAAPMQCPSTSARGKTVQQCPSEPPTKRRKTSESDDEGELTEQELLGENITDDKGTDNIFTEIESAFEDKEEMGPPVSLKLANLLRARF